MASAPRFSDTHAPIVHGCTASPGDNGFPSRVERPRAEGARSVLPAMSPRDDPASRARAETSRGDDEGAADAGHFPGREGVTRFPRFPHTPAALVAPWAGAHGSTR